MTKRKIIEKFKLPNVFLLLLIVLLSCAMLIFINYFTIKILSANRAYVNGESHYSKAQKDATRHLITYLYTKDENHWFSFKEELLVPQSDGIARIALSNNSDTEEIKKALRAGRNHEADLDAMIWLYKNFKSVPFLAKAIKEWEEADQLIIRLAAIGDEVHPKIKANALDTASRERYLNKISSISDLLNIKERNFSNTLGHGTRAIRDYLIFTNIFFILLIISSGSIYYSIMVKKLWLSMHETEVQNENLIVANKELDKFVYSASHDLRSPITSLKGLIEIARDEDDVKKIRDYLALMHESLTMQDQFISDIIDYSRNKRKEHVQELINLDCLIDEVVAQHQHIKEANTIDIKKELAIDKIYSDSVRLKIILNNLVSNAIKYSDKAKMKRFISIKASNNDSSYQIEIEDNGIGIKDEYKNRIFEMFFVTNNNMGSGLGLYIAKEAAENLNGDIRVNSEINVGTKFTVTIPKPNGS
nr:HAMP domain-containing sensor histidine kinase [uncultured Flavobacterium sp.]